MAGKLTYITLKDEMDTLVYTKRDLCEQLAEMGLRKGMVILVQANMDRLGHIVGGAQTLIDALKEAVGYEGTIVIPTFTTYLSDPSSQKKVSRECWEDVRENSLPFDRKLTVSPNADELIRQFLRNEGIARSYHPLYSFAAWGKYAKLICDKHPLHFGLSETSPLGKVTDFNGFVVLLGCDYDECVVFDQVRYSNNEMPIKITCAPIETSGNMEWKEMLELDFRYRDNGEIGDIMEERKVVKISYIGKAKSYFFSSKKAVELSTAYFHVHDYL